MAHPQAISHADFCDFVCVGGKGWFGAKVVDFLAGGGKFGC